MNLKAVEMTTKEQAIKALFDVAIAAYRMCEDSEESSHGIMVDARQMKELCDALDVLDEIKDPYQNIIMTGPERALHLALEGNAVFCRPCRETGAIHCSDPANCGGPWSSL